MTKHYCNRCGKIIEKCDVTENVNDAKAIFKDGLRYVDVDFCSECADLLIKMIDDFWKGGAS